VIPNTSTVNGVRLLADQNIAAAPITNVSTLGGAEVATVVPSNTAPGEIFIVEATGAVPANTAPGEIYIHGAAA
jgi:flagellin-like hook-associated protein FlgL